MEPVYKLSRFGGLRGREVVLFAAFIGKMVKLQASIRIVIPLNYALRGAPDGGLSRKEPLGDTRQHAVSASGAEQTRQLQPPDARNLHP